MFGLLGLDGDLKKAMKDGKPVIIEVEILNLCSALECMTHRINTIS